MAHTHLSTRPSAQAASSERCSSPGVPPSVSGRLRSVLRASVRPCLCSAVPSVALAFLVATLVGAASVAYMTTTTAIAQIRTEPHMIGRVLALQTVLLVGTAPIGGPILGAIADAVGGRAPGPPRG